MASTLRCYGALRTLMALVIQQVHHPRTPVNKLGELSTTTANSHVMSSPCGSGGGDLIFD